MISLENLPLYVPLAAILVILPGPDFALIAKISLLDGRRQGQAAACGVALGIVIHTSAAMLGISAIIAQSVFLFSILKYVGAAYLLWLGIHALRRGRAVSRAVVRTAPLPGREPESMTDTTARPAPRVLWRAFKQGFLTNLLNPKAVLIFLTFLPQFMNPHMPLVPQFLNWAASCRCSVCSGTCPWPIFWARCAGPLKIPVSSNGCTAAPASCSSPSASNFWPRGACRLTGRLQRQHY